MSSVISFTTALCHATTTSGISVHHPPIQGCSPLLFFIMSRSDSRLPSSSCHGAAFGCCRTGSTDAKVGSGQKGGPELRGQTGSGKVAAKKKNQCIEALHSGAPPIFPFPFPFSLFPGLPPPTTSGFWHGASTDIQQCSRLPLIARGRMTRLGFSWPGAGESTVDQTRFTATAKA